MSTYVNIGSNLTSFAAHVATQGDGSRSIILSGHAGTYPLMSVLMSPETAQSLLESLSAALAEVSAQLEEAA